MLLGCGGLATAGRRVEAVSRIHGDFSPMTSTRSPVTPLVARPVHADRGGGAAVDAGRRIVLTSIGTASPADAARVAVGLGVPVPGVVTAFYRAPAVLVDRVAEATADNMAELLRSMGCEVCVEPVDAVLPEQGTLFDVAVRVLDESAFEDVADALAGFIASSAEEARRLLLATPALVLGGVTEPTVAALRARLGEVAHVMISDPEVARYDVLLADGAGIQRDRVRADLLEWGHDPSPEGPWLLRDLTKAQADRVWATHRRVSGLQVANQDFYRFEVVLETGGQARSTAASQALIALGVPEGLVGDVLAAAPIGVADELDHDQALAAVAVLTQAGLEAHADLTTFLHLGVRVTEGAGLSRILGPWPELTARVFCAQLRRSGGVAELIDADEVPA